MRDLSVVVSLLVTGKVREENLTIHCSEMSTKFTYNLQDFQIAIKRLGFD